MNNTKTRRLLPIRFDKLEVGSMFRIFAEPSRSIAKVNDPTVYQKKCEAYSLDSGDEDRAIILMPEDRVIPLTRGKK